MEDEDLPGRSRIEPEREGRPVFYIAGLIALFAGLFITLGSLVHNNVKIFVNDTSWSVYGPYDWAAAIIGAIVLLVGIILLMFSKAASKSS